MPFNRVNDMKSMVYWLLILKEYEVDNLEALKRDPCTKVDLIRKIPTYYPGFMLIPIPEAGFFLRHIDMAWWAVFLYLLGSIFYVIDSFYLWLLTNPDYTDDANNPAIYLNTIAAVTFVVNAIVCFIDWWLQFKQLGAMNLLYDESLTGGVHISEVPHKISVYYFYNNLFFLGAAVVYLIQAIWYENPDYDLYNCNANFCGSFWINFWGSFLYLLSSIFAVGECYEAYKLRAAQGLPPLVWFGCEFTMIDWFGWGDVLYLVTSLVAMAQTFLTSFAGVGDDFISPFYLTENWLFLFDSAAYFIGYCLFIWELRQTLKTGMLDAKQTGAFNALIGDNYERTENEEKGADQIEETGRRSEFPQNRGSFSTNVKGQISMQEIRLRLNEARNIRLRRSADRLTLANKSGTVQRNTIAIVPRKGNTSFEKVSTDRQSDKDKQRSASFSHSSDRSVIRNPLL